MATEIKVPVLPESVSDATVVNWHKQAGESIARDEQLVDLETDKVVLEVTAPDDGVLSKILKEEGATVLAEEVLALFEAGAISTSAPAKAAAEPEAAAADEGESNDALSPSVRRLISEKNVDVSAVKGTGKGGRITKSDVEKHLTSAKPAAATVSQPTAPAGVGERTEERVPMSRLRARVAERLLEAQHNTAMLTTFNEVNLQVVMDTRKKYKDHFEKKHGVRLGFMSFFTKAVVEALKRFPAVNASIDGSDMVYRGYFDIGIAVSSPRGLVVPVLRNVEQMSMAQIEGQIGEYAGKARDGKLTMEEMTGGTFTITNGGVFGSLLSTPILNPPQSAILGMHKIEQRPIVENGEIVIRPMMYIAMSYDHRIIDGKESVSFLAAVKEMLEYPAGLLLDV